MKTIGLIGGMSFESTLTYYQVINETVNKELGGLHSAKIILHSVDFAEIEEHQSNNEWHKSAEQLSNIAKSLEASGADFILICTNTMHKVADEVQRAINIPLLHIATVTGDALLEKRIKKVALLGTKYTMQQDFYKQKLIDMGIDVIIPEEEDQQLVNSIIFDELCHGKIIKSSKDELIRIAHALKEKNAEGLILGCTELGLILKQEDCTIKLFDTTIIHAKHAALNALK